MANEYKLTYYPWITQHRDPGDIRQAINDFATAVEKQLGSGTRIEVLKPVEVSAQIDWIATQDSDKGTALMNPLGFVLARSANVQAINVALRGEIKLLPDGTVERTGNLVPQYRAQIYTNVKTAIKRVKPGNEKNFLAQVWRKTGTTIGFGTCVSTSNFLFPACDLRSRFKVSPLTSFTAVQYLGGHDIVAKAVYDGKVDIGAGHDGAILDLAGQPGYGDAEQVLFPLHWTDPIPSDPVAANIPDDAERKAVQSAFVAASKTKDGSGALSVFWGGVTTLDVQTSDKYDVIADRLKYLNLSQVDLLGP